MIALAIMAACITACGGGDDPQHHPPPDAGVPDAISVTGSERLGWSQQVPSNDVLSRYRFDLVIDGALTVLSGVSCVRNSETANYACTAPLPPMLPGRHVLEVIAVDQSSGRTSPRSAPLVISLAASSTAQGADRPVADVPVTPVTCATELPGACFTITTIAIDVGPVRRLLALPDGRLLVLREDGVVTMLPSGTSEQPDLGRARAGSTFEVADVAADAEFVVNRFLYFATTATAPDGNRTVSVVRVRELADRLAEAATIVTDVPVSPVGRAVLTVGPDRHLYLAMPSAPGSAASARPYDGYVLRFAPDGTGAGHARLGSPILGGGSARPATLAWAGSSRLLLGSTNGLPEPRLAIVPVDLGAAQWPAAAIPVGGVDARLFEAGIEDALVRPDSDGRRGGIAVWILGAAPAALYTARLASVGAPEVASVQQLPLGSFTPTAIAAAGTEDLIVAATRGGDSAVVSLLRLRPVARAPR